MRGRHSFGHRFDLQVLFYPPRTAPNLPITAGVGLGFWVVPSSHMLKTEFLCHFCGKGFSGVLSEIKVISWTASGTCLTQLLTCL